MPKPNEYSSKNTLIDINFYFSFSYHFHLFNHEKIILASLLVVSTAVFANLKELVPTEGVKASDINSNFNYLKSLLSAKNIQINFSSFNSGELILTETFESEFDKLRVLGIDINHLSSSKIKSADLNLAFSQSESGILVYDDTPVAQSASFSTNEDTVYNGSFGYTNNVGNTSIEIISSTTKGSLTKNGINYTYSPNVDYFGSDFFSFRVFDGVQYSEPATVSINVVAVNDAPVAAAKNLNTNEDTNLNISLSGSDVENSPLSFIIVSDPLHGSLSGSGASRIYIPSLNFNGSDSFSYKVNDGSLDSETVTVSLTINAVNDAPIALAQNLSTPEDTAINITLSGSDVENSTLNYTIVSPPTKGTLSGSGSSRVYTPNLDYFGSDSFTYKVNDGALDSQVVSVSITINAIDDVPVAFSQNLAVNEDTALPITLTGFDAEGATLTYSLISSPANGVLSGNGATRSYTPNLNYFGSDSFTFKVSDGTLSSTTATVNITINSVNDIPVISGSAIATTMNSSAVSGNISVTDVDSSSFTYVVVTAPTKGSFAFTSGGNYSYTPVLNQYGSDSIVVKVNDGISYSSLFTIPVTITGSGIIMNAATSSRMYYDGTYASSCNAYKNGNTAPKTYTGNTGTGMYRIQSGAEIIDVHCDMDIQGGGWTLVAFNNGASGTGNVPSNFFGIIKNAGNMFNINGANSSSSLNLERMSSVLGSKDIMLIAPAYGGSFNPLVELNAGAWTYNSPKCGGTFRHTSRSAGCSGQNANDDYSSADGYNFSFNNGAEGIVPGWLNSGHELCYSGRGWCNFKVYFR